MSIWPEDSDLVVGLWSYARHILVLLVLPKVEFRVAR